MIDSKAIGLPDELVAFLEGGKQLDYDPERAQPGRVILNRLGDLKLVTLAVDSEGNRDASDDPCAGLSGHYEVPVVDLVSQCEMFDPTGILVWLPDLHEFGTWDSDHWDLLRFPGASWDEIVRDPLRFINAQWLPDSQAPGSYLAPWTMGYSFRRGPH